jgi:hypothetical protein
MRKDYLYSIAASALTGLALAAGSIYYGRSYGMALFYAVPVVMGFVASAVLRRFGQRRLQDSMLCTFGGALLASLVFLVMGLEGLVCIVLAIPLASPFLAIGALLGYFAFHRRRVPASSSALIVVVVAILIAAESHMQSPARLDIVDDSILVHAPASDVWTSVVALDSVPPPRNWMYRAGLACPLRTRIESQRAGGYRVCTLSTGQLVEQIEVWRPGRLLRWHSRVTPPPMRETNPFYRNVDPPHLHGFYESPRGEFALEAIGPRLTRLTRRTWYSQRLQPSFYWSLLCELGISQIHRTVLEHVRNMAEARGGPGVRI